MSMSMTASGLGEMIRAERKGRKLTQAAFAQLVNDEVPDGRALTRYTLATIERGEHRAVALLLGICNDLGLILVKPAS